MKGEFRGWVNRFAGCILSFLILFFFSEANSQHVKVTGGFITDSLKIGEQTAYYLSAHYPKELNILFPDSTFDYSPFEYENRKYFPTQTRDSLSFDSTVYYLTTFDVTRIQYLELPVFVIQQSDCTIFRSPRDSILITQLVAHVPDTLSADKLPLKMNTAYQKVFFEFNFWVLLIALGVLIVIGVVIWVFFGKRISRYFKARKLKKNHSQFLETYNTTLNQLKNTFSEMTAESALSSWKKYMEQLEAYPYTKLTTRETLSIVNDEMLGKNLHAIDTAIYGHNTAVVEPLETLKSFADQRFSKKLEEVTHGK